MHNQTRTILGLVMAVLLLGVFTSCSLFDSAEVQMVKTGKLGTCPNKTVEEMVNGFMGNPSWESGVATTGQEFVNIYGDITYYDKPVRALIQFVIYKDKGTFDLQAVEFNGVPQNALISMAVLQKMCE